MNRWNATKDGPAPQERLTDRDRVVKAFREEAVGQYLDEGVLEFDDEPLVSDTPGAGAYVQARVWVDQSGLSQEVQDLIGDGDEQEAK